MYGNKCIFKIQNAENCSTPKVFASPKAAPIIIHQRLQQALEPAEGELYGALDKSEIIFHIMPIC